MESQPADCCPPRVDPPTVSIAAGPARRGTAWLLAAGAGSILTAFLASACCHVIAATVASLGAGFYFTHRKPRVARAPGSSGVVGDACDCPPPWTNRGGRMLLWLAAVLQAGFLAFPHLVPIRF